MDVCGRKEFAVGLGFRCKRKAVTTRLPSGASMFVPKRAMGSPTCVPRSRLRTTCLRDLTRPVKVPALARLTKPKGAIAVIIPSHMGNKRRTADREGLDVGCVLGRLCTTNVRGGSVLFVVSGKLRPEDARTSTGTVFKRRLFGRF